MLEILEQEKIRQSVFPISLAFYHEAVQSGMLSEDVELLEGVIVRKMSKSPLHESLVRILAKFFRANISDEYYVAKEGPLTIGNSEPEPDLAVIKGDENEIRTEHPDGAAMVIEVAVTSLETDMAKAAIYAEAGVQEYWIIDVKAHKVICFSDPKPEERRFQKETVCEKTETITSSVFPEASVSLETLFP